METNVAELFNNLIGWSCGSQIPVANEENRRLEKEVAELMLRRVNAKREYEAASEKYDALQTHRKFVEQEAEQVQSLIAAHRQQIENEAHVLQITKSEKARLNQDIQKMQKNFESVTDRVTMKKTDVQKGLAKIESMKKESDWDTEALRAWEDTLKKRDADNELLKKFTQEDEKRFLELEARRNLLQMEHDQRKELVTKLVNELTNYESILERTGKSIKHQIAERDALIQQWNETVNILHQRDKDIDRAQTQLLDHKDRVAKEMEILRIENQFLEREKNNNIEIEREIEELNAQSSIFQKEFSNISQYVLLLKNEANGLRRRLTATANGLEKERCNRKNLELSVEDKENCIANLNKKLDSMKQKYKEIQNSNFSAADRAARLERMIETEQKQENLLISDNTKMQHILFQTSQELEEEKNLTKRKLLEITNVSNNIQYLRKVNREAESKLEQKKENLYTMDYRINNLNSRIDKIENTRDDSTEDSEEQVNTLKQLESTFAENTEVKNMLQEQVTRIQDEMHRLSTALSQDETKLIYLTDKLDNQKLFYEGGCKQVIKARQETQEKQVEENLLRLKLTQFDKIMKSEEKTIYNLQKFRLNLEQSMRERELEIKTNKELLLVKKRSLDEDKGRLRADINNRNLKIDQLQKNYHMVLMSLGKDDGGQPLSITHYKMKAAQEKYMLQQEGDELDEKIQRAEKEIVAMENTLKIVNMTNTTYKKCLQAVDDTGEEMEKMKELEEEHLVVSQKAKEKKKAYDSKKAEIIELEQEINRLLQKKVELHEALGALEDEFNDLVKSNEEKQQKLKRAGCLLKKVSKQIKLRETASKFTKDLDIKQLSEANKTAMQRLTELSNKYPETIPTINRYKDQYKVTFPDVKTLYSYSSESSFLSNSGECTSSKSSARNGMKSGTKSTSSSTISLAKLELKFGG